MRNTTKTARQRRISNFLTTRKQTPKNFTFVREHLGSINFSRIETIYRCDFKSRVTGRTAFAFGRNFQRAYTNMIGLYELKYSTDGRL